MKWIVLVISVVYLGIIFPFAYFRHDDWLILGNAVLRLDEDWTFLFTPSLYSFEREFVWFFRPLFKGFTYLFFQLFHYNYYAWLASLWLITIGAVYCGYRTVKLLTGSPDAGLLFAVAFLASFHLHLGSLSWMGEGIMNCPQVLFLALNLYWLSLSVKRPGKPLYPLLAVLAYLLALGVKESSVFHLLFLIALLWGEPYFRAFSRWQRGRMIILYMGISGLYLFLRLGVMPVNHMYLAQQSIGKVLYSFGWLVTFLFIPLGVCWVVFFFRNRTLCQKFTYQIGKRWFFFGCILFSLVPYLGHDFFSPGWILLPAFYMVMGVALSVQGSFDEQRLSVLWIVGLFLFVGTGTGVLIRLNQLSWWDWHKGQKQIHAIVAESPSSLKKIVIFECKNPEQRNAYLRRVIGFEAGIYEMWKLHHEKPIVIAYKSCNEIAKASSDKDTLFLKWYFPRFQILSDADKT